MYDYLIAAIVGAMTPSTQPQQTNSSQDTPPEKSKHRRLWPPTLVSGSSPRICQRVADTIQVVDTDDSVPATGVTVTPATTSVVVGTTRQLTGTVLPADATDKSGTWTTSDATKATVSSTGLVTGVAAGTATITFKSNDGNFTGTTTVTVTAS